MKSPSELRQIDGEDDLSNNGSSRIRIRQKRTHVSICRAGFFNMNSEKRDIVIIGGGIIGLGTAMALAERFPRYSVTILEKEAQLASHQTGHNSGVIHAGIYYKPGTYKARLCVSGVRLLTKFCEESGVPYDRCGKLITATSQNELPRLWNLYERGTANGIPGLEVISAERAREIEPHVATVKALYSPNTAIVDFAEVCNAMALKLVSRGIEILKGTRANSIRKSDGQLYVETGRGAVAARYLICCGGLQSDRLARMMGIEPEVRVIPFRGEYYSLQPGQTLVRGLIYPVPDPEFPFLGVHFTRRIRGGYEAGPNAVLALARQGYRKTDICPVDLWEMARFPGFWAMGRRYWRMAVYEYYRSFSRRAFVRALQKLVPALEDKNLAPGGSGVRAQCVRRNGTMVDDFLILEAPNAIHVLNAPSPAATASLAIGAHIADLAGKSFGLES
jgi:L-2-hydroxyglutarate oxidase LhgO